MNLCGRNLRELKKGSIVKHKVANEDNDWETIKVTIVSDLSVQFMKHIFLHQMNQCH